MKITFLMPGYIWGPSGGIRVVYEYANHLVSRGHEVAIVHPRRIEYPPALPVRGTYWKLRNAFFDMRDQFAEPTVDWQCLSKKVELLFVPNSDPCHVPDGDVIFATSWRTVHSVLGYPPAKGEKYYLIQGYETWMGPKDQVDETWRAPLKKVVVAEWLREKGSELGCHDLTYIPNATDHSRYRVLRPIEQRPRQVAMMFSAVPIKGSADGLKALEIARGQYPDLNVIAFGTGRRQSWVPKWVRYYRNAEQQFIIHEIYNKSAIFVSPSWSEGFPLPPVEAAACGCALVATDIGGVRDYIENEVTGLLSPPKEPESLARNVCRLLGDDKLRVRLAYEACDRMKKFRWERSTDLLEACITNGVNVPPLDIGSK